MNMKSKQYMLIISDSLKLLFRKNNCLFNKMLKRLYFQNKKPYNNNEVYMPISPNGLIVRQHWRARQILLAPKHSKLKIDWCGREGRLHTRLHLYVVRSASHISRLTALERDIDHKVHSLSKFNKHSGIYIMLSTLDWRHA